MSKRWILVAMAAALAASQGCAGFMEFRVPKEFKEGKSIEDPPISLIPNTKPEAPLC